MNSEHHYHGNLELSFGFLIGLTILSENHYPHKSHFKGEIQKRPPGYCRANREYDINPRVQLLSSQEDSGTNREDVRKDNNIG